MNKQKKQILYLFERMAQTFDLTELHLLSFKLFLDWDELNGNNKSAKLVSLITALARKQQINQLIDLLREERKHISWPDVDSDILVKVDFEDLLMNRGDRLNPDSTNKIVASDGGIIKVKKTIEQVGDENIIQVNKGEIEAGRIIQKNRGK